MNCRVLQRIAHPLRIRLELREEFAIREPSSIAKRFLRSSGGTSGRLNRSLVGDSKIGKSSILLMLQTHGPKKLKLPPDRFIYLDMQNVRNEGEFFTELCLQMAIEDCRGLKLVRALKGKSYFLFLDEIEKMLNPEQFSMEIRSELNGLADGLGAPLRLVIASRSPLSQLFPDSPVQTSPLSGNCLQLDVPPFSEAVTSKFVAQRPLAQD